MFIQQENKIKLDVKEKDEETGEIKVVGTLNALEVNFLVQYAINALMAQGVLFELSEQSDSKLRIYREDGTTLQ